MKLVLLSLGIGLLAGILAGLCGVGGGIVMVPAFVFLLGLEQKEAVATSIAVIVPTALIAIFRFSNAGLVQWNIFWPTAVGAMVAAWFATGWVRKLSNEQLTKIFAVLMIAVGISMLLKKA
ncbi:MAG: sulfite exporter TauE/SafE family protein [Verrucomicrobiota bacterium]